MLFSMLLAVIGFLMGLAAKTNKAFRELISPMNCAFVVMTADGKRGRRFVITDGRYSSDKLLKDYDLALVFKNADIGFKALALGGATGMQAAMNNYDLKLMGNQQLFNGFGILLLVTMGTIKRK